MKSKLSRMLKDLRARRESIYGRRSANQGPPLDLMRLANALSTLYPRESEEKRLLDAMLLAVPR
jgi:putative DNA methylase